MLTSQTDARGVTADRTVDAADRVTFVNYHDANLDTTYTWDSAPGCNAVGRLTSIARGSTSVDYCYDAFGEALDDGVLSYTYDGNGNRLTIAYPGNLTATYTFDKMDRPASLVIQEAGQTAQTIVTSSPAPAVMYKPFGPLWNYRFGTGTARDVTRGFDRRYFPQSIAVSGSQFSWVFSTDHVGNITAIDDTLQTNQDRSFVYQDWQYFLARAAGPWGAWSWTYDRAGNRTFEDGDGGVGALTYVRNAADTGNTSVLVSAGGAKPRSYFFDAAGNLDLFTADANEIDFVIGNDGRPFEIARTSGNEGIALTYDGRGFLSRAQVTKSEPPYWPGDLWTEATYSSEGTLMSLERETAPETVTERTNVLYFGSAPIALWKKPGAGTAATLRLVTDHLGAPAASLLATTGNRDWYGGFEPFGRDWQEGNPTLSAFAKGILLRLPGQWDDPLWNDATLGADVYYNVHRWYEQQTGRYSSPDPLPMRYRDESSVYRYASSNPLISTDELGLCEFKPCSQLSGPPPPCNCDKRRVEEAAANGAGLAGLFCKYANSPTCPPGIPCGGTLPEPCDPRVAGRLNPGDGAPEYKPQGDPCLDWCTCQHEGQHDRDLHDPRVTRVLGPHLPRQTRINWLECRAYVIGGACLQHLAGGGS